VMLLVSTLFGSGNSVASRLAVGEISPMTLTASRWAIVLAVLCVFGRDAIRAGAGQLRARWRTILLMGASTPPITPRGT